MTRLWSDAERVALDRLMKAGLNMRQCAVLLERPYSSVTQIVRSRFKVGRKPKPAPALYRPARIVSPPRVRRTFDELLAAVRAGEVRVVERPVMHRAETMSYSGISTVYDG